MGESQKAPPLAGELSVNDSEQTEGEYLTALGFFEPFPFQLLITFAATNAGWNMVVLQRCRLQYSLFRPILPSLHRPLDRRVGVISLDFIGQDNAEVAFRLETEFGILTRCGLHCAPNAHKTLSTFPQGTVRFSLGFANTEDDVDRTVEAVKRLAEG